MPRIPALFSTLSVLVATFPAADGQQGFPSGSEKGSSPAASATASLSPSPSPAGHAPSGNRYDVLSRMIRPLAGVLLGGDKVQGNQDRALVLRATVGQVAGRLPGAIQGAAFKAMIEYPGRVRLEAPVLGTTVTVCRDGNQAWAVPGSKVGFLLGQFHRKPPPRKIGATPLALPFTPQQAVLLPALFQLEDSSEVAEMGGAPCRVISGGLMQEVGKAANAGDFSAKLWIAPDYSPKRVDIRRSDFAMSFLLEEFSYAPSLPASTWQPPQGESDVMRCDAARLEELLYVVMNSLQMSAEDKPWLNGPDRPAEGPPPPFGPIR